MIKNRIMNNLEIGKVGKMLLIIQNQSSTPLSGPSSSRNSFRDTLYVCIILGLELRLINFLFSVTISYFCKSISLSIETFPAAMWFTFHFTLISQIPSVRSKAFCLLTLPKCYFPSLFSSRKCRDILLNPGMTCFPNYDSKPVLHCLFNLPEPLCD